MALFHAPQTAKGKANLGQSRPEISWNVELEVGSRYGIVTCKLIRIGSRKQWDGYGQCGGPKLLGYTGDC